MAIRHQTREPTPRVAVIGTGTMGTAMGRRLLGSGLDVDVWSRHRGSTASLVALGATAYESVADAVKEADVVITMLPTAEATEEVMFGRLALPAMRPESLWVQMATIGVDATEHLAAEAKTRRPGVPSSTHRFRGAASRRRPASS